MAILIRCSCGKQLRAPEELRGRRIKCPACSHVVAVAAQPTLDGQAATLPPVPPLQVTCACGKKLQGAAHLAGKSVRCPGCGEALRMPDPASSQPTITHEPQEDLGDLPKRKKADPGTKTRRKKGRRRSRHRPLWPWIAGAASLVVVVGLCLWLFVFRGTGEPKGLVQRSSQNPAAELDFVPADAVMFYSLRLGDLWESEKGRLARQAVAEYDLEGLFEKFVGIPLRDIQRVIIVVPGFDGGHMVVTTNKPYDQAKLLAALFPGAVAQSVNGKELRVTANGVFAVHFAGPQLFLLGMTPSLKKVLQGPVSRTGILSDALHLADQHIAVMAINLTAPDVRKAFNPKSLPPAVLPFAPLLEAQTIVMTADLSGEADLLLQFADEAAAKKGKDCVKPLLDMLEQQIPGFIKTVLPGKEKEAQDYTKMYISMLRSVKVDADRSLIHLQVRFPQGSQRQMIKGIRESMEQLQALFGKGQAQGRPPTGQGRRQPGRKLPPPQGRQGQ